MLYNKIWNKEYKLYIWYEECSESPRHFDNLWTLLTMHRKYNLWDETFESHWNSMKEDFAIFINNKYKILERESDYYLSEKEFTKIWQYIDKYILYQLVSMTDHSWVYLNIWHPIDRWDSWYVWYIFAHKNKIKENFNIKKVSKEFIDKTYKIFEWEIYTMNKYLSWEIYEYILESRYVTIVDWKEYFTEWDNEDLCWWFYELSDISEYIDSELFTKQEILNYYI